MAGKRINVEDLTPEQKARVSKLLGRSDALDAMDEAEMKDRAKAVAQMMELCNAIVTGVGKDLKQAREKASLSLSAVHKLTGIDTAAISRIENGLNMNPTIETLSRLAIASGKRVKLELVDE